MFNFGFDAASMVKKGKWDKLVAFIEKEDVEKCVEIAKACAQNKSDESYNTLISMLNSDNRDCKLAAVQALGEQGRPTSITQLMYQSKAVGDDKELAAAISKAMEQLHQVKED